MDLGVTYALHLLLVGKPVVDFLFIIIEHFCCLLRLRRCKWQSVIVGVFRRGWVTLSTNLRQKGALPTNHCWCQKTKMIAVSCGTKISAVHCLVLSQSTRVTDGQNYDSQDHACVAACAVKTNEGNFAKFWSQVYLGS